MSFINFYQTFNRFFSVCIRWFFLPLLCDKHNHFNATDRKSILCLVGVLANIDFIFLITCGQIKQNTIRVHCTRIFLHGQNKKCIILQTLITIRHAVIQCIHLRPIGRRIHFMTSRRPVNAKALTYILPGSLCTL